MAHTIRDKDKLIARVRRIRGQVDAIERAFGAEAGCERIMHLLASTRAAFTSLSMAVIEDHVRSHLVPPAGHDEAQVGKAADQLLDTIRTYVR